MAAFIDIGKNNNSNNNKIKLYSSSRSGVSYDGRKNANDLIIQLKKTRTHTNMHTYIHNTPLLITFIHLYNNKIHLQS